MTPQPLNRPCGVDVLAAHVPAVCVKDPRTIDFHTKSYSFEFVCPCCKKARRVNTNYLGCKRHVVCNGERVTLEAKPSGGGPALAAVEGQP